MIRINLLTVERKAVSTKGTFTLRDNHKIAIGCALLLLATATLVGWRYWALGAQSVRLDRDISASQKEAVRLRLIIAQVQQFEQHKKQLEQRVTLIEQLRREQSGPVHILDQISLAVPPMLWLTELKQGADPNEVAIHGRCTNLTSLTDYVRTLEASGYFKKSIEIVNTRTDTSAGAAGEMVSFSLLAKFQRPGEAGATPSVVGVAAAGSKQG